MKKKLGIIIFWIPISLFIIAITGSFILSCDPGGRIINYEKMILPSFACIFGMLFYLIDLFSRDQEYGKSDLSWHFTSLKRKKLSAILCPLSFILYAIGYLTFPLPLSELVFPQTLFGFCNNSPLCGPSFSHFTAFPFCSIVLFILFQIIIEIISLVKLIKRKKPINIALV